MIKHLLRLVAVLMVLLSFPAPALALNWNTSAYDHWASNESYSGWRRYYWTGTSTYNYVMASPTITFSHVNSIYMRTYNVDIKNKVGTGYELGWAWDYDRPKPYWFRFVIENGQLRTPTTPGYAANVNNGVQVLVDPAQPGYTAGNALWVFSNPSGRVVFRIDNTQNTWYWPPQAGGIAYMREGLSAWGSERQNLNENNYAHFWALGKQNHAYQWNSWQNQANHKSNDENPNRSPTNNYHLWKRGPVGTVAGETEGWSWVYEPVSGAVHLF